MGEAKRKKQVAAAEQQLTAALASCSIPPSPPPGVNWVQALVVQVDHAEAARKALGALPAVVEQYLSDAIEMRSQPEGAEVPGAVCWERWPSGRVSVHLLKFPDSHVRETYLQGNVFDAEARAYGFRVAAFPPDGWTETLQGIHDQHARFLSEIADLADGTELVQHLSPRPGFSVIRIPRIDHDGQEAVAGAQALRILDAMVANKESMLGSHRTLRLSFDGYDDDPREVWDIEWPAQFIRMINAHAPWWPWLVAEEQVYVWLGALLAHSPTVVSSTMKVGFEFDQAEAEELFTETIERCTDALLAANVDMNQEEHLESLSGVVLLFREALDQVRQVHEDLKTGVAKAAIKEEVLEFQRRRIGVADEVAPEGLVVIQHATMLDRSERGQQLLEQIEANDVFPEPIRAKLRRWHNGEEALIVISGRSGNENSWTVQASGTSDEELESVVAFVTADAMKAKASLAWAMGVSNSLVARLSPMVRTAAIQEVERLGLGVGGSVELGTQLHKGLLDLAIAPGGEEVDFDHVQILDAGVFGRVADLGMSEWTEKFAMLRSGEIDAEDVNDSALDVRAWKREDGSLLIRENSPPMKEVVAPSGTWRLLDPVQRRQVETEARRRMSRAPSQELEGLAKYFNASFESRNRQKKAWDRVVEHATSVVGLFGRDSSSLLLLRNMIGDKADANDLADRWLQSSEAYYLFWRAQDGQAAAIIVNDEEELFSRGLEDAMKLGSSPQNTLLVVVTGTDVDAKAAAWWTKHGGLFGHQISPDH